MDNNFPTTNKTIDFDGIKSMFNKPGGTFAKITAVCAGLCIGYGFIKALPFLIAAATNTLILIGELVAIGAIGAILLNKDTWKWVSLFWLQVTKKVYGCFVKIDPISILQRNIDNMKKKLNTIIDSSTKLNAIIINMENKLKGYQKDLQKAKERYTVAQNQLNSQSYTNDEQKLNFECIVSRTAREIVDVKDTCEEMTNTIEVSKKYQSVINKLRICCESTILDAERQLKLTKDKYEMAKEKLNIFSAVESLLHGNEDQMLNDLALEHINDTINLSMAKMDSFLNDSNSLFNNYDLDSAVNIEKVNAMLNQYNNDQKFLDIINNNVIDINAVEIKEPVKVLAYNNEDNNNNSRPSYF